jgi:hypothetical protein
VSIRHILATPDHPQTNGKSERYHPTLKTEVNQVPYELVSDLERAFGAIVGFHNHRRYHKALGDVTSADVLEGRQEAILARRKEVQRETFERRRRYNQEIRETLKRGASSRQSLWPRTVHLRDIQEHWIHIGITTPMESIFAGVRIRTDTAKGLRRRDNGICLVSKILERLQGHWQILNVGANLTALVLAG